VAIVTDILKNAKDNRELLTDALSLAATTGGDASRDAVTALLSTDLPAEIRTDITVQAIEALGKMKDAKAIPTLALHTGDPQPRIAIAATLALGQVNGKTSLYALTDRLLHDNRLDLRRAAAVALTTLKSRDAIPALLDATKDKDINNDVIKALCATPTIKALDAYLDGVSSPDGGVRADARKALTSIKKEALPLIEARLDTNPLSTQAISEIQGIYAKEIPEKDRTSKLWKFDTKKLAPEAFANFAKSHKGNADNGKKIFKTESLGCIKCHKVGNEGADIGPVLTGVGAKYDRTFLIESVLYPSKQILDGYQQTIIRLKDGDVQSGVIKAETDKDITLFDASANKTVIEKSDIKEREPGKLSLMPEGLHTSLKPEEFSDLISYLESLKETPNKK
jgi:putative heme-binding domain-containing protein